MIDGNAQRDNVLSVMSPVYLGEESLERLVEAIDAAVSPMKIRYEILLVEDGSPDNSWAVIQQLCERHKHVRGLRLSRNFGQHYAISAGLAAASGDYVILLDCDLQDDPAYIPVLYEKALEGYDVVYTLKNQRRHRGLKDRLSKAFHWLLNTLVQDQRQQSNAQVGNFSLMSRAAVNAFLKVNDYHRHYLGIVRWIGFPSAYVPIEHKERPFGSTSYTTMKLVREAIAGITSQSDRLLYLSILLGFAFVGISLVSAAIIVVSYFTSGFREGWTSIIVLMLLSTGIILISLGVVGIYVGKVFEQTKGRPLYLVQERLNFGPAVARPNVPARPAAAKCKPKRLIAVEPPATESKTSPGRHAR